MMNEFVLLLQIAAITISALCALRFGKEALVTFVVLQITFANLFVLKQISLFGLNATASDAYIVGSLLGLNLIQEFFSPRLAQQTVAFTFGFSLLYVIVAQLHLLYVPALSDTMQAHFVALLSPAPLLVLASVGVYICTQLIDLALYRFLNRLWHTQFLMMRNLIAIGISQLADTLLFTFCLWWLKLVDRPFDVFVVSFSIKCIVTLIATPALIFMAKKYNPKDSSQ